MNNNTADLERIRTLNAQYIKDLAQIRALESSLKDMRESRDAWQAKAAHWQTQHIAAQYALQFVFSL